jgi:hypothetical protein
MLSQIIFRSALWMSLGVWVGSWAFFAFVISRIAFQILPGDVAGDLAGTLLGILHFGGAAAAIVAAGAAAALGRRGVFIVLPMGLALICLISEIWITPGIAAVRPSAIGPTSTVESAELFRHLHQLSIGLFLAVHLGSIVLIVLHARLDARQTRPNP